jgi:lipid-binding SYLF domain-containing protein
MQNRALNEEAAATLERLQVVHPDLKDQLEKAYAYAVFPSMGRASAVLGVSFGRGVVFEQNQRIGTATITEITVGVQVGGQTFSELLFFPQKQQLDELKHGEVAFAANASAGIVKAAATGTTDFKGVVAKAYSQGGMILELSLGGQKLSFKPTEGEEAQEEETAGPETTQQAGPETTQQAGPETTQQAGPEATQQAGPEATQQAGPETAQQDDPDDDPPPAQGDGTEHRTLKDRARSFVGKFAGNHVMPAFVQRRLGSPGRRVAKAYQALRDEQTVSKLLHPESRAALARLLEKKPGLREQVEKAYGYAIFPSLGKAGAVLGVTYGRGEVFEHGQLIGYAGLVQLTIGVQLGGDTGIELVLFDNRQALERFKMGKVGFAANAAAVIVKAGAAATNGPMHLAPNGGLLIEAALGGQKFVYRPAALTRGKTLQVETMYA